MTKPDSKTIAALESQKQIIQDAIDGKTIVWTHKLNCSDSHILPINARTSFNFEHYLYSVKREPREGWIGVVGAGEIGYSTREELLLKLGGPSASCEGGDQKPCFFEPVHVREIID